MLESLWADIQPIIIGAIATIVAAVVAILTKKLNDIADNVIIGQLRSRVLDATANGAKVAMSDGLIGSEAVAATVDYVNARVPDAVKKLKASPDALKDLAKAETMKPTPSIQVK